MNTTDGRNGGEITLSTIGSLGVTVDVGPAALAEAGPGGVAIKLGLHDGPLILTFTSQEARDLYGRLELERKQSTPGKESS
jgi:hypothetical protein